MSCGARPSNRALLCDPNLLPYCCWRWLRLGGVDRHHSRDVEGKRRSGAGDNGGIFVAAADIAMGDRLTAENTKFQQWPKDKTPARAMSRMQDIENRRVRTKLYAGEPILENRLCGKGANQQGATAMIPIGYRVVPVKVDLVSGGSDLILPGDRVDVMIHLVRDPNRGIEETITRTILQDIKVFAVNDVLDLEKDKDGNKSIPAKTISLLVTPEQAAKIMLATQTGIINLVMRSSEEDKKDAQVEVRMADLLHTAGGSQRDKEGSQQTPAPAEKELAAAAVALPPVEAAKSPNATWTVKVLKGNAVDEVVFEKDSNANSASDSWRIASTTNIVAGSPAKEEPKIETPVRLPPESAAARP